MDYYRHQGERYEDRSSVRENGIISSGAYLHQVAQSQAAGTSLLDKHDDSSLVVSRNTDSEMENKQLKQELEYQQKLQRRVKTQTEENEKIFIPRLDLSSMEDEGKKPDHGAIDISLRDSLEDEKLISETQDSLEWDNPPELPATNKHLSVVGPHTLTSSSNQMGGADDDPFPYRTKEERLQALMRGDYISGGQAQPASVSQNELHDEVPHQAAVFEPDLKFSEHTEVPGSHWKVPAGLKQGTGGSHQGAIPGHILDVYNQHNAASLQPLESDTTDQETSHVGDANNNAKISHILPSHGHDSGRELPSHINDYSNYGQVGMGGYAGIHHYDPPLAIDPYIDQHAAPQVSTADYQHQYFDALLDYSPAHQHVIDSPHYVHSDVGSFRDGPGVVIDKDSWQQQDPGVDFLERNKERIGKPPSGKKYSSIYQKKKESAEEPKPVFTKKNSVVKKTPVVTQKVNGGNHENFVNMTDGPEDLWKRQAQKLAQNKERISGSKRQVMNKGLKRFPSEGRMDRLVDGKGLPHTDLMLSTQQPVPNELTSEVNRMEQPSTHTIYTENGQKFSVDINLKVLSPNTEKSNPHRLPQSSIPVQYPGAEQVHLHRHPHHLPKYDSVPGHYDFHDPRHPTHMPRRHSSPEHGTLPPPDSDMQYIHHGPLETFTAHERDIYRSAYGAASLHNPSYPRYVPDMNGPQVHPQPKYHHPAYHSSQPAQHHQQYYQDGMMDGNLPSDLAFVPDSAAQDATAPPLNNKPPTPLGSPYQVLPPIGPAEVLEHQLTSTEGGTSPRKNEGGSYMESYRKQKEKKEKKPVYKTYTLDDFRKLNKEVRLGGLGPDVESETLREKREKVSRQHEYARQITERNKSTVKQGAPAKQATKEEEELADLVNRRKIALNYAKSIPRPKVQLNQYDMQPLQQQQPSSGRNSDIRSGAPSGRSAAHSGQVSAQSGKPSSQAGKRTQLSTRPSPSSHSNASPIHVQNESDLVNLTQLQERHLQEKEQAALIRQNIQGIS